MEEKATCSSWPGQRQGISSHSGGTQPGLQEEAHYGMDRYRRRVDNSISPPCAPDLVLELPPHSHLVLATTFKQVLLRPTYEAGHGSIHLFPQRGTGMAPNSGELSKGFRSPVYSCSSLWKKAVSWALRYPHLDNPPPSQGQAWE